MENNAHSETHHLTDGVHCQHEGKCLDDGVKLYIPWQSYRKLLIPDGRFMVVRDGLIGTCWPDRFTDDDCPWCLSLTDLNIASDARPKITFGAFQVYTDKVAVSLKELGVAAEVMTRTLAAVGQKLTDLTTA